MQFELYNFEGFLQITWMIPQLPNVEVTTYSLSCLLTPLLQEKKDMSILQIIQIYFHSFSVNGRKLCLFTEYIKCQMH